MNASVLFGQLAGLGTAVAWAASALFFTRASGRIGSFSMSHFRMLFAVVMIFAAFVLTHGRVWPEGCDARTMGLMAVSGFLGFFACDALLFQSYVDIGTRLGSLFFNLYPVMGALVAFFLLGERMNAQGWLGMMVAITGVVWVALEKRGEPGFSHPRRHFKRGVALALGAAFFEAISLIAAKPAMTTEHGMDPLAATFIRALVGGGAYWVVSLCRRRLTHVVKKARETKAMLLIAGGAVVGPFLGVWLSMVAVERVPVGIASTLMALMPVAILPMNAIIDRERISWRAVVGAIIACLGAAILFNR